MSDLYDTLIDRAVPFYREHGVVDIVTLADAVSEGFAAETFTADVARRADQPTED